LYYIYNLNKYKIINILVKNKLKSNKYIFYN
jgi:hypothetical protein